MTRTTARGGASLTLAIVVHDPVPGVELGVQHGRADLLGPVARSADTVRFEFQVDAEVRADGTLVLRGPVVQGPPAARFVYVNAGTYAGQAATPVGRRAKVPLTALSAKLVTVALADPDAILVCEIGGRARDGGPAAASVPLRGPGWRLERRR